MNIISTDENCYLLELTKEDMENFNIKYNPDGIYTEKEESIFIHILKEYEKSFSFNKIILDILPGIPDGCVAVVKRKDEVYESSALFESSDLDNFIDCAKVLFGRKQKAPSSLYKCDDTYRLILHKDEKSVSSVLCEFSEKPYFQESEIKCTKSSWECLIENTALEILCGKSLKL